MSFFNVNRALRTAHRFSSLLLAAIFISISAAAFADPYDLIICGKGGEEVYDKKFPEWGRRLQTVLIDKLKHPKENVRLLLDPDSDPKPDPKDFSQLEIVRKALQEDAAKLKPGDVVFVYMIGHGSYLKGVSKFDIDGPDLTGEDLNALLAAIPALHAIVIDAASSSAGFINALSGPGRIICAATRSVDEKNATEFMEHFIQGMEDGSADQNRDDRISVLEACSQGAVLTAASYLGQGLIQTEHALLDDNGDSLGTRLPIEPDDPAKPAPKTPPPPKDGSEAALIFFKDFIFPPTVPKEMIESYRNALDAVEKLKTQKSTMDAAEYQGQLESLLIKAARINKDIHAKM